MGYLINIWLARYLGPADYGTYGVVMSLLLWIEMGTISGLPGAGQKFISAYENRAYGVLVSIIRLQAIFIAILFLLSFIAAPFIGSLLKDN